MLRDIVFAITSRALFRAHVQEKGQAAREKQLAVQSHWDLPAVRHSFQLLLGKKEKAFRRSKLATNGMRDVTAGFKGIRVSLIDDPRLRSIHKDPPEAMPHSIAGAALPILPGPDERAFVHASGALVELLIH
jgi:hypothetical protein